MNTFCVITTKLVGPFELILLRRGTSACGYSPYKNKEHSSSPFLMINQLKSLIYFLKLFLLSMVNYSGYTNFAAPTLWYVKHAVSFANLYITIPVRKFSKRSFNITSHSKPTAYTTSKYCSHYQEPFKVHCWT